MAITLPAAAEPVRTPASGFAVTSDLLSEGRFGSSRLTVDDGQATRYDENLVVSEFRLEELENLKIEELVDGVAIVGRYRGEQVELIRGTSRRALALANAHKRLEALMKGEAMPEFEETERVCPKCGKPLPKESDVCESCINRGKTLVRLFSYAAPFKLRLLWASALTIGGTALELLPPYLTLRLIDDVLRQGKVDYFAPLMAALVFSRLGIMGVQIARGRNVSYLGMQISVSIRDSLFRKFQELSLAFYDKRNVGSIMSRMTNDTSAVYDVLVDGVPVVLNQSMLLIGIPIAMLIINAQIAIWVLAPIPLVLFAVRLFRRKMHRVWSRVWHAWSRLSGTLNGVLQGTKVVKAFHGEKREVERFGRRIRELARNGYEAESSWSTFFPVIMFLMASSAFVVWWIGGHAVLANRMTLGELTAFIGYLAMMQQPMMMLQRIVDWTTRSLTAAERVFEVLDTPVEIQDKPEALPIPELQGRIAMKGVRFAYDKTREVVRGIDIAIEPGEMIGLVGRSGSGKTTLVSLLLRFYDPTQGTIEFDGIDLRDLSIEDFRRQVGVVLQESYLFPGSIKDNIAYGRPGCSLTEIIDAAKAANAHTFIANFPDGYDTYVGERGQRLSGGERQRIAIARAILHDPKVLILDEATSSVDTETERMIQEALERLVAGRTVIAIAHRLSTLRAADRLVVMEDGAVVETGTHDELMDKPEGVYAKLVQMQLEMNRTKLNFGDVGEDDDDPDDPTKAEESSEP